MESDEAYKGVIKCDLWSGEEVINRSRFRYCFDVGIIRKGF